MERWDCDEFVLVDRNPENVSAGLIWWHVSDFRFRRSDMYQISFVIRKEILGVLFCARFVHHLERVAPWGKDIVGLETYREKECGLGSVKSCRLRCAWWGIRSYSFSPYGVNKIYPLLYTFLSLYRCTVDVAHEVKWSNTDDFKVWTVNYKLLQHGVSVSSLHGSCLYIHDRKKLNCPFSIPFSMEYIYSNLHILNSQTPTPCQGLNTLPQTPCRNTLFQRNQIPH
jgi:hypothetical protein